MMRLRVPIILMGLALATGVVKAETKAERLDRLVGAYPQALAGHDGNQIFWRDGTTMSVDDGIENKRFEDLLRKATILNQLSLF